MWTCKELNKGGPSNNYKGDFLTTKDGDIRELIKIWIFKMAMHSDLYGTWIIVVVWWAFSAEQRSCSVAVEKTARAGRTAEHRLHVTFVILYLARRVLPLCTVCCGICGGHTCEIRQYCLYNLRLSCVPRHHTHCLIPASYLSVVTVTPCGSRGCSGWLFNLKFWSQLN